MLHCFVHWMQCKLFLAKISFPSVKFYLINCVLCSKRLSILYRFVRYSKLFQNYFSIFLFPTIFLFITDHHLCIHIIYLWGCIIFTLYYVNFQLLYQHKIMLSANFYAKICSTFNKHMIFLLWLNLFLYNITHTGDVMISYIIVHFHFTFSLQYLNLFSIQKDWCIFIVAAHNSNCITELLFWIKQYRKRRKKKISCCLLLYQVNWKIKKKKKNYWY